MPDPKNGSKRCRRRPIASRLSADLPPNQKGEARTNPDLLLLTVARCGERERVESARRRSHSASFDRDGVGGASVVMIVRLARGQRGRFSCDLPKPAVAGSWPHTGISLVSTPRSAVASTPPRPLRSPAERVQHRAAQRASSLHRFRPGRFLGEHRDGSPGPRWMIVQTNGGCGVCKCGQVALVKPASVSGSVPPNKLVRIRAQLPAVPVSTVHNAPPLLH